MSETHSSQIFLGRQPILGREQQLVAYELLFRDERAHPGNQAEILDPTQATATVIANAFTELATTEVLGPYRAFINVDRELLFSDLIEALPPKLTALEISESIEPTQEVIARCERLRGLGWTWCRRASPASAEPARGPAQVCQRLGLGSSMPRRGAAESLTAV